jgi:hypothetical protein
VLLLCLIGTLNERKLDCCTVLSVMVQRKAYLIVAQMKEMVDVEQLKMLLSYAMVFPFIRVHACCTHPIAIYIIILCNEQVCRVYKNHSVIAYAHHFQVPCMLATIWRVIFRGANFRGKSEKVLRTNFRGFKFRESRSAALHKRLCNRYALSISLDFLVTKPLLQRNLDK